MKEDTSQQKIEAAIDRLFRLSKPEIPIVEEDRQGFCSAASATFESKPFSAIVTSIRDHLTQISVLHDSGGRSGDWIRGAIYALDRVYGEYELLSQEDKQPKPNITE